MMQNLNEEELFKNLTSRISKLDNAFDEMQNTIDKVSLERDLWRNAAEEEHLLFETGRKKYIFLEQKIDTMKAAIQELISDFDNDNLIEDKGGEYYINKLRIAITELNK